jgi:hypothetical protein
MKRWLATLAVAVMILSIAGCQSEKTTVLTLQTGSDAATMPVVQTTKAQEKGTYYLYSSADPNTPKYHIDLKRGDEFGFRTSGNRTQGYARGVLIELSDLSEGATYTWKVEPEKKKN